jgi:hypothetical protein
MVNAGSAGGSLREFWLSGEALSVCVTVRLVILALRVYLRVKSGSACAPWCDFWLSGEAESVCGSPRLAILAL